MVNRNDDPQTGLEQRSKALFDESVEHLSGNIRSRLTQARHKAVAEASTSHVTRRFWLPAVGLAVAAVAAVMIVMPRVRSDRGLPESFVAADDMTILLNSDDDLELLEDMEFYAWMDSEAAASDGDSSDVRT
jgi:hypothetical protein